jgi:uncharacterized protein (DUF1778 family)
LTILEATMPEHNIPSRARGVLAFRISAAERRMLEEAAAGRCEYLTTYIRDAALAAARRDVGAAPSDR